MPTSPGYCAICAAATVALAQRMPAALALLIIDYVHSPITMLSHKMTGRIFYAACTQIAHEPMIEVSNSESARRMANRSDLPFAHLTVGKWVVSFDGRLESTARAIVQRPPAIRHHDANIFNCSGPPAAEFLDDLLACYPDDADVRTAVASIRHRLMDYFMDELYGPAHGVSAPPKR